MAKGSRGGKNGRQGSARNLDPRNIKNSRSLVSERGAKTQEVDSVLTVSRDLFDQYGEVVGDFRLADIGGRDANTMAYAGGGVIGFNSKYFDVAKMNSAYDDCVKQGFHPSRGKKNGIEAVAAHEFGHDLTNAVGRKMGIGEDTDAAATAIVKEARKQTSHRGVVQMASKISGYATYSNAEAVAEAFSDVYCNGKRAKKESRAIVDVMNKYLK